MAAQNRALNFDETGFLRRGVHDCSWEHFRSLTFTNGHRSNLGSRLIGFLEWAIRLQGFSRIYVGGGFLSKRPFPRDIDVILETKDPFGPLAFSAIEPLFVMGLENIRQQYSVHVHFWMENAPNSLADYRYFFQYWSPAKCEKVKLRRKGIIRLPLSLSPSPAEQLRSISEQEKKSPNWSAEKTVAPNDQAAQKSLHSAKCKPETLVSMPALGTLLLACIFAISFTLFSFAKGYEPNSLDAGSSSDQSNESTGYPRFSVPKDYSDSGLPGIRFTARTATFPVVINGVKISVVYSLPMEGMRVAPTASNLIFYGPYPGEKPRLDSNIVPDLVTKLGCTVFSFQFDDLGQSVSPTPYWSEPRWFAAALAARDQIIGAYGLERKKLILLGYSAGAGMVMNIAGKYPDQIEAIAAQAPNVVPSFPHGNSIKWLMVVNRGDGNRLVMKPFYDQLRAEGCNALYCETTPDRNRGYYHAPSNQTFELIYSFVAGILDQRHLSGEGIDDIARLWPYAAPAGPLERFAIVKTVHLEPEDLSSGKFDLLPSLAFTIDWSQVCPPEQISAPVGTHAKLNLNFPARGTPVGIILYYDRPSLADVPREVEDINSLAEHGYLVVSSMTATPEAFVDAATAWIRSQSKLNGLHIHLVGNGAPGAEFISKMAARRDVGFKSICLIDFTGSFFHSESLETLASAAKECGMYGFYTYSESDESVDLFCWAAELVGQGAKDRGCFNLRVKVEDSVGTAEDQKHKQAEIQALTMIEALIAKADSP